MTVTLTGLFILLSVWVSVILISRCLGRNKILTRNFNQMFLLLCLLYFILLFLFTAAVRSYSLVFRQAGPGWQSVKERGGGCHLSVKAALASSRPGVLGQLASELASVTVEEWMLNNRARSAALPPGWLAGVTRQGWGQSQLQSITFTWGRGEAERERERLS